MDIEQELFEELTSFMRFMAAKKGDAFARFDIGRSQLQVLYQLTHGPQPVGGLAKTLSVTTGAVSQILDPLLTRALVQRENDEDDRRIVRYSLTPKGEEYFEQIRLAHRQRLAEIFQVFNKTEQQQFLTLIRKLKTAHGHKEEGK